MYVYNYVGIAVDVGIELFGTCVGWWLMYSESCFCVYPGFPYPALSLLYRVMCLHGTPQLQLPGYRCLLYRIWAFWSDG